jgi:hypothetical protein
MAEHDSPLVWLQRMIPLIWREPGGDFYEQNKDRDREETMPAKVRRRSYAGDETQTKGPRNAV